MDYHYILWKETERIVILGLVKRICRGYTGMALTEKGIAFLCLPQKTESGATEKIRNHFPGEQVKFTSRHDPANRIWESLEGYFRGKVRTFEFALDLEMGTDFERSIWERTRRIPYGETRSYIWVAEESGYRFACRAAGNALGKNPIPILVPCHRVIRSDGYLGGFGAGIRWKWTLLDLEKRN
jgi:methylated-DNA-[protein]-cysteine S-methyltransferase